MHDSLEKFVSFYQQLDADALSRLSDVYSDDAEFCDPIHRIVGLDRLNQYFYEMVKELDSCQFDIEQIMEQESEAYVRWIMHFQHPKLKNSSVISVPGVSHLKFDEKISYHRDYFDVGAMLYENIPVLGSIVRKIKQRLAS